MITNICPNCGSEDIEENGPYDLFVGRQVFNVDYLCLGCDESFDEPSAISDDPADHKNELEDSPKGENR